MKEALAETLKDLPSNITLAWGRSDVSFGEITFIIPNDKHVHLGKIIRDEGEFDDSTWWQLLAECVREATNNPQNKYHLVRVDNSKFVPENANNAPFRGKTKTMEMFGYKYISKDTI